MGSFEQNTLPDNWNKVRSSKILQTWKPVEYWNILQKINNILEGFDVSDEKYNKHLNILEGLNQEQLAVIKKLNKAKFEELLNKPKNEIPQFLIQAQINELEAKGLGNLTNDEFAKFVSLKKKVIAVEKSETKIKSDKHKKEINLIDDKLKIQNHKLDELRGILLSNSKIKDNPKVKILYGMLDATDKSSDQKEAKRKFTEIINFLKQAWTIESIAQDLGANSQDYFDFKTDLLKFEPSLQASFDRAEMNLLWNLAKAKLWTDNLNGVNLENDTLLKIDWNLIIEVWKNARNLNLLEFTS